VVEKIRDRVRELRRVKASELVPNPRTGAVIQRSSRPLKGLLAEVDTPMRSSPRELPDGRLC